VNLQTELANDLPSVVGDRVQLQQVLLNLVMNGMDAILVSQSRSLECCEELIARRTGRVGGANRPRHGNQTARA